MKFLKRFDIRKIGTADELVLSSAVTVGVVILAAIRLSTLLAGGG